MNKKFDMEKNQKRYKNYLGKTSLNMTSGYNPLNNNTDIVGDCITTDKFTFTFISSHNPFVEFSELDGKWKQRKGMTVCYITDTNSVDRIIFGVGFAICSENDEFSHQEGYKKALLDAMYCMFEKALDKIKDERNVFIENVMKCFLQNPPKETSMNGLHDNALRLKKSYFG